MSTNEERAKALERIQNLLRMAKDDRGNVHEAENALRMAQKLMAKFNIDEAEAIQKDLQTPDSETMVKAWRSAGKDTSVSKATYELPKWGSFLSYGIGKLYDCQAVIGWVTMPDGTRAKAYVFAGYKVDVQVACWTFDYLCDCVKRASRNFETAFQQAVKANSPQALEEYGIGSMHEVFDLMQLSEKSRRGQFRRAMCITLQRRMLALKAERDSYNKTEAEKGNGTALAIIDRKLALIEEKFGVYEGGTHTTRRTSAASGAGVVVGHRTELNPNPVTNGGKSGPLERLK